jgi:oxaloacetate decarboxylase alpha subunit/pyruvate carboxylase subunit B
MSKTEGEQKAEKVEKVAPPRSSAARTYNVFVDNEYYQVVVDPVGGTRTVSQPAAFAAPAAAQPKPLPKVSAPAAAAPSAAPAPRKAASPVAAGDNALISSMPGTVRKYIVSVGQAVKAGDPVVVVEAMKMESTLPSPVDGKVKEIRFKAGDRIVKGDVIAVFEK